VRAAREVDQLQRITAFFLLLILGGNFLLSVFWPSWQIFLPHDHIILGPIYPGWEHHHDRELAHLAAHAELRHPSMDERAISTEIGAGARSKVISLYRSPAGDDTIFSVEVQLLWLAEWPLLAKLPSLTWSLDQAFLPLSSAFLPPPDKPPASI
jgi:hypothetical protein